MPYKCLTSGGNVRTEFAKVSSISGYHFYQKQNKDVERLEFVSVWSKYIPNGFGDFFPNLSEMEIRETPLKSLRRSNFARMGKLLILNLDNTRLSEINDDTFVDLVHLQELVISKSFLKRLPDELLVPLGKLRLFDAKHNQIEKLGKNFFDANPKLETINLSGNNFKEIKADFTKLEKVNEIYLFNSGCVNTLFMKSSSVFTLNDLKRSIKKRCLFID